MNRRAKKPLARVSQTRQIWNGFHLWRGHIYGEDANGPYVTGVQRAYGGSGIIVYRAIRIGECYRWHKAIEPVHTETGRAILAAALTRPCVDFGTIGEQVRRIYSPCVTTNVLVWC